MNNLLDLIKSRRSRRHFTAQAVPDEVVDTILEAGSWANSLFFRE